MKKPDRFERMCTKLFFGDDREMRNSHVSYQEVEKLLRRQHRAMVRMVKKVDAWACQELADNDDVIAEILKQLAQRRK